MLTAEQRLYFGVTTLFIHHQLTVSHKIDTSRLIKISVEKCRALKVQARLLWSVTACKLKQASLESTSRKAWENENQI